MFTKAKKILITAESHEVFIVHRKLSERLDRNCPECGSEAEMLTLDEFVSFTGISTWELIRRIESGAVHSTETASGHLLVCPRSEITRRQL